MCLGLRECDEIAANGYEGFRMTGGAAEASAAAAE